ncbi:hypothetical protein TIFTF001_043968 [Ficus carica]|uniref:Uncharacterized protein n=1 Tax=Ficus carica TaxID=3494 RepID=A0AA88CLM5_FICCA|nr:hypothetical protein TIFTF001_043968 [Ficus carica]
MDRFWRVKRGYIYWSPKDLSIQCDLGKRHGVLLVVDGGDDVSEIVAEQRVMQCLDWASKVKMGPARRKETRRKVIPKDPLTCVDHQGAS